MPLSSELDSELKALKDILKAHLSHIRKEFDVIVDSADADVNQEATALKEFSFAEIHVSE